jgi:hypothetical protein
MEREATEHRRRSVAALARRDGAANVKPFTFNREI